VENVGRGKIRSPNQARRIVENDSRIGIDFALGFSLVMQRRHAIIFPSPPRRPKDGSSN